MCNLISSISYILYLISLPLLWRYFKIPIFIVLFSFLAASCILSIRYPFCVTLRDLFSSSFINVFTYLLTCRCGPVVFCPPLPYWSETQFNSTDNNFLSVITYWCNDGYAFKGHTTKPGNETVLSSMCLASKQWYPAILDCQCTHSFILSLSDKHSQCWNCWGLVAVLLSRTWDSRTRTRTWKLVLKDPPAQGLSLRTTTLVGGGG